MCALTDNLAKVCAWSEPVNTRLIRSVAGTTVEIFMATDYPKHGSTDIAC